MRGRHATRAEAPRRRSARPAARFRVPVDAPEWLLSPPVMRAFNGLYYWLHGGPPGPGGDRRIGSLVSCESFFYPLDVVARLEPALRPPRVPPVPVRACRGRRACPAIRDARAHRAAGAASFLAVIKDCGPAGPAPLSFPIEGVTLGLDLPYRGPATDALVHELNAVVIAAGGRVYLAKDAVTRAEDFARMMPRLAEWRARARPLGSRPPLPLRPVRAAPRGPRVKAAFVGATRGHRQALARRHGRARRRALPARPGRGGRSPSPRATSRRAARGRRCGTAALDLGGPAGFAAALDAADAALGGFDTLVVTGGLFGAPGGARARTRCGSSGCSRANFTGTALLCQQAAARLAERGGGVVCAFCSVAGERAREDQLPLRRVQGRALAPSSTASASPTPIAACAWSA